MRMKRIFGLPVHLLIFVTQTAIKCQATFCSDRKTKLEQELFDHCVRCIYPAVQSGCCEAEKSSLEERKRNHGILCCEFYNKIYLLASS